MIDELDRALKALLKQEMGLEDDRIRFEAPDESFAPTPPALDLFLYDVRENRELRSNEWIVNRDTSGAITKQQPPARVDCSYLITAWAGDVASEHKLLGDVMRVLLRFPVLPAQVLKGDLAGQTPPLPASVLQPGLLQSVGEFWQALGGKPKAALHLTVTVGVEAFPPVEAGRPVTDKRIPG
jgi:hypothetical protein